MERHGLGKLILLTLYAANIYGAVYSAGVIYKGRCAQFYASSWDVGTS